MSPLTPEPAPTTGHGDMWAQVIARMGPDDPLRTYAEQRRAQGFERYGVLLQAFNGRNPIIDLFQEQMDSIVYAEQWHQEATTEKARDCAVQMRWDAINNARKLLEFIK